MEEGVKNSDFFVLVLTGADDHGATSGDGSPGYVSTSQGRSYVGGFKLSYDYQVEASGSYELMLDFDAHQSIRQTGNGRYQLQPVITVAYFGPPQEHAEDVAEGDEGSEEDELGDTGAWDTGGWDSGM